MSSDKKPCQWNCPNCGYEMISSGVDMDDYEEICQERDALMEMLRRIRGWDMLDACADGPYWKREIDSALAE